ncbi:hypothetical protein JYB87_10730 [Shewanella avicenniae]|uniref:Photosynthesis system II assembly factor Ycf48/Hcf136-like domain-containing protein n=1 Tax=Shewanella avicenniae TaxID=2814294 RepID=A0ABX7QLC5_9GAMM|nr:kelch repeat-containing protein [Shewanella avicenniae]QSX32252.1 hypothetical protein JYB87_10730 [Shewanella avicenniae]
MAKLLQGLACTLMLMGTAHANETTQLDGSIDFRAVYWHGNQVWASGTAGSIFMSVDNGKHWQPVTAPQNTEQFEFRDIQPLGDGKVLLMSAGSGEASRLYMTENEGIDWRQVSSGQNPKQFYDCLQMIDNDAGWLYGDSDDAGLFILQTQDGGANWQREQLPISVQANEGGFASSGTCVNRGDSNIKVVIGTGNAATPRLLLRDAGGWMSIDSPFPGGEASGIFSVQLNGDDIYAFGGSLNPSNQTAIVYRFNLIDKQWQPLPPVPLKGAIYGSAILRANGREQIWIANPNGVASLDITPVTNSSSTDSSLTDSLLTKTAVTDTQETDTTAWQRRGKLNMWSIACRDEVGCISVGQQGTVQRFMQKPLVSN